MNAPSGSGQYVFARVPSAVGALTLVGSDRGLAAVLWEHYDLRHAPVLAERADPKHPMLVDARRQLDEYFAGRRRAFDLALEFVGTDFQKRVWSALLHIPFGTTTTYGEIARRLGDQRKARAVGAANGRNPIPIVAPCHRVIGASGRLTGFGGGLKTKAALLAFERGGTEGLALLLR